MERRSRSDFYTEIRKQLTVEMWGRTSHFCQSGSWHIFFPPRIADFLLLGRGTPASVAADPGGMRMKLSMLLLRSALLWLLEQLLVDRGREEWTQLLLQLLLLLLQCGRSLAFLCLLLSHRNAVHSRLQLAGGCCSANDILVRTQLHHGLHPILVKLK